MRKLIAYGGAHVRRRTGRRGRVLLLIVLFGAVAACAVAGGRALVNLSENLGPDFFGAALAAELGPSGSPREALLDAALSPVMSLVRRPEPEDDDGAAAIPPSAEASPAAEPSAPPPSAPPSETPGTEPDASPAPSREPNAADLDPNIRTVSIIPSDTAGYDYADGVFIKNGTSFDIDVSSYLEAVPEFDVMPHILIVHTHASESYYPSEEYDYEPTDVERTEDTDFNVVRVGDELESVLRGRGLEVTHIREIFDYPSYSGSYARTLEAIEAALRDDGEISVVIDLHRDAVEGADGSTWRVISEQEDGSYAAQSMLVIGTDEGGLSHPNWRQNLLFAVHLQKYIVDRHPTLMRPITLSPSRYNQHATPASVILEIGTSGNTLDEALLSARMIGGELANLLDELVSE